MPAENTDNTHRRGMNSNTRSKKATLLTAGTAYESFDSPSSASPLTPYSNFDSAPQTPTRSDGDDGTPSGSPHVSMQVQRGGSPPPYAIDRLKQEQDEAGVDAERDTDLKDSDCFQLPWPKGVKSDAQKDVAQRLDAALRVATDFQAARDGSSQGTTRGTGSSVDKALTKKNMRVIGVDFDDVCAQFIPVVQEEHNARYGTNLSVADMQTYCFFQCRGWGTPAEVARKMKGLDNLLPKTAPVPGFVEGLKALHAMGHPIHIVTARARDSEADMLKWLAEQGITVGLGENDVIAHIWFTDSYGSHKPHIPERGDTASAIEREDKLNEELKDIWRAGIGSGKGGKGKLKVLRAINAALFIDDHHGNLEPIVRADPPVKCLLFGKYAWNRSRSGVSSPVELMSYDERIRSGLALQLEEIAECDKLARAETWSDVVQWVKRWDAQGSASA